MFDPIIARWLIPDPYRQHWSPYVAMGNNPINFVDPSGGVDVDPKEGEVNKDGQVFASGKWITPLEEIVVFAPKQFEPKRNPVPRDAVTYVLNSHPVSEKLNRFLSLKRGVSLESCNGTGEIKTEGIAEQSGNLDVLDDSNLTNNKLMDFINAFRNLFGTGHEKVHSPTIPSDSSVSEYESGQVILPGFKLGPKRQREIIRTYDRKTKELLSRDTVLHFR